MLAWTIRTADWFDGMLVEQQRFARERTVGTRSDRIGATTPPGVEIAIHEQFEPWIVIQHRLDTQCERAVLDELDGVERVEARQGQAQSEPDLDILGLEVRQSQRAAELQTARRIEPEHLGQLRQLVGERDVGDQVDTWLEVDRELAVGRSRRHQWIATDAAVEIVEEVEAVTGRARRRPPRSLRAG